MPGAGVANIIDWRTAVLAKKKPEGVTPLAIAELLQAHSSKALQALPGLRKVEIVAEAKEYAATLGDIEAMAHLGHYYAAKIRGACDLALFDKTGDDKHKAAAVTHLEAALSHWKDYAAAYVRQYTQPVLFNRAGVVDIPKQTANAAADVTMARDWKKETIDEKAHQALRHREGLPRVKSPASEACVITSSTA